MTVFYMDPEPESERVWLTVEQEDGHRDITEWRRAQDGTTHVWKRETGFVCSWPELLNMGSVSDAHPALPQHAPTPWRVAHGEARNSDGGWIDFSDPDVSAFIVGAVNFYAAHVIEHGVPAAEGAGRG